MLPEDVLPARVHEHPGEDALVPRQRVDDERHRHVARAADRARVVAVAEDVDVDARARSSQNQTSAFATIRPIVTTGDDPGRDVVPKREHAV